MALIVFARPVSRPKRSPLSGYLGDDSPFRLMTESFHPAFRAEPDVDAFRFRGRGDRLARLLVAR